MSFLVRFCVRYAESVFLLSSLFMFVLYSILPVSCVLLIVFYTSLSSSSFLSLSHYFFWRHWKDTQRKTGAVSRKVCTSAGEGSSPDYHLFLSIRFIVSSLCFLFLCVCVWFSNILKAAELVRQLAAVKIQ